MVEFTNKINLLGYDRKRLRAFFEHIGEKSFRADQVFQWIHQYGVTDFSAMSNLSKALRDNLSQIAMVEAPKVVFQQDSKDGTAKWLIEVKGGSCIEMVYIPEGKRGTLCVSSQVGCALNCSFCSTAKQGFNRDLEAFEIIGQVWQAVRYLSKDGLTKDRVVTNVVMMGMGEPLLNYDNVVSSMDIMMDDLAYGLSKYRVTLSTSGVVPKMYELAKDSEVALAVSLHAPNDVLRDELVPVNKKYNLAQLMKACKDYFPKDSKRQITMEYVMLDGVNDKPEQARQLVKLLQGVPAKVNLIPFNPYPHAIYRRSSPERIEAFRYILVKSGINTITRKTRGDDIDAACGQLAGKVQDKTRRSERYQRQIMLQQEQIVT